MKRLKQTVQPLTSEITINTALRITPLLFVTVLLVLIRAHLFHNNVTVFIPKMVEKQPK